MSKTLLVAERIERHRGAHTILAGTSLTVRSGGRIGLIGPNGAGKSTLLRILAGVEAPDRGTVRALAPRCYLGQAEAEPVSALAWLESVTGARAATAALDRCTAALAQDPTREAIDAHANALERWLALGGAEARSTLVAAARTRGIGTELLDRPISLLSGGQAARLGLAAIATASVTKSVLLLDEPSNHLDADGLEELAQLLRVHSAGFILVSHDRQLLAGTCDEIVVLDRRSGAATHFECDYDTYERERALAAERTAQEYKQALRRREDRLAADRELKERAARTARASRTRRDNDKHVRNHAKAQSQAVQARARKLSARVRREPLPEKPWVTPASGLTLTAAERRGAWIIALQGAVWQRGQWRLGPLDLALRAGQRVALVGPNGAGKSTVLDTLAGRLTPTAGQLVLAAGGVVAELGQRHSALAGERKLTAAVRELTGADESAARTALARFGLSAEQAERPAATLSPGERTRAELAMLGLRRADCLLLDEPTNHLDIEALEALQDALRDWPGALVIASHDRRLLDALEVESRIELGGELS